MTTTVITQPNYLPWLGYFEQMERADIFILLDNVQYVKREWMNRNRLKGFDGKPFWLTVPVKLHSQKTRLLDVTISRGQPRWPDKHLRSIKTHLGKAPYFEEIFEPLEGWLQAGHYYLVDLNITGIRLLADLMGLSPVFMRASEMDVAGEKGELILNLCKAAGTDLYYTSMGSKAYLEAVEHLFHENGIEVVYQEWEHPTYRQRGNRFLSHLSIVDTLMNVGSTGTRALFRSMDSIPSVDS